MKTKQLILIIFSVLFFLGCKPVKEIQYVDKYHEVLKKDSVYKFQKDTMYLTKKGDTIFVNNFSTKIDYKYKYINKIDTVTKTNILTKTVTQIKEKKVTKAFGWIDWGLIGIVFLYGIFRLLKFLKVI